MRQSVAAPASPSGLPSASTSKNNGDTTFEPTVDMMVNDFDDEQTLEEEEALAAREAEDPVAELNTLQKESDMPIEELLALYNCAGPVNSQTVTTSSQNSRRMTSTSSSIHEGSEEQNGEHEEEDEDEDVDEEEDEEEEEEEEETKSRSQLRKLYPETYGTSSDKRLLRTISRQQSDEEDDGEYSPDEDEFKKTIMVGSEFQAVIPEGFSKYDDVLPYENEDKLLWDPSRLEWQQTEDFLQKAQQSKIQNSNGIDAIPLGSHLRDDEQDLYLLHQCGYNMEEALRRKKLNPISSTEQMSLWSEEECRNFENGLRVYGKDFHAIKHEKVCTRSVGELVQFYYLWKKTERHDVFANKARLEKKKYSLNPGLTDYMDRFLEEQDGSNGNNINNNLNRDRSSSPNAGGNNAHNAELKQRKNSTSISNQKHVESNINSNKLQKEEDVLQTPNNDDEDPKDNSSTTVSVSIKLDRSASEQELNDESKISSSNNSQ